MFGFTRSEQRVILFLTAAFFCGALIRAVREDARPLPDAAEPGIQVQPDAPETPRENAGGEAVLARIGDLQGMLE